MKIPNKDALKHKNQLFRTLRAILKDSVLANRLIFKGGTFASLSGRLDRFSVDLDFDIENLSPEESDKLRSKMHVLFESLRLDVKDESKNHLQFFLKYPAKPNDRNTLKIEINDQVSKFNKYEKVYLQEVDIFCNGHTEGTMFANKLVAAKSRYDEGKRIAGRDFYDIHYFFNQGMEINKDVVEDFTGLSFHEYMNVLIKFIEVNVDEKLLIQDLNPLLPPNEKNFIKDKLKPELLFFLRSFV